MFKKPLGRWLAALPPMAAMLVLSGCGSGGGAGDVSGKVTYQGKALPSGRITFLCKGGDKPVLSSAIKDGEYSIEKAAAGPARVAVETFQFKTVPIPGATKSSTLPGSDAPPPGPYVPIPQKYRTPDSSGLTYTISKGKQTKDFDLAP
jgi:hypothetical protein